MDLKFKRTMLVMDRRMEQNMVMVVSTLAEDPDHK